MRSPRSRFETACRVGAFAALGWLLGSSLLPTRRTLIDRVPAADLERRLPELTRSARGLAIHATLPVAPPAWQVEWLDALDRADGRAVSWEGTPPAVAMSVEPLADPNGGARIDVAAPNGSAVTLRDDASAIDSVKVAALGATIVTPIALGEIRGDVAGQHVAARGADSVRTRAAMVVGAAGWEAKFVASALEERGWPVIARFTVAPNVDVTQGAGPALDTSRVAVLVAIDSTVEALGAAVERFVRSGGGLVLAGTSARARNVAALAPGTLAARTRPVVRPTDTVRLGSTGFYPLSVGENGVALERRSDGVSVAARRLGAGRVIQLGYDDSWRWRMAGVTGSEVAHREWWSRIIRAAAYAPVADGASPGEAFDAAPLASLVDRLGPARSLGEGLPSRPIDPRWLIALMVLLLLAEWASRRLRGLR